MPPIGELLPPGAPVGDGSDGGGSGGARSGCVVEGRRAPTGVVVSGGRNDGAASPPEVLRAPLLTAAPWLVEAVCRRCW